MLLCCWCMPSWRLHGSSVLFLSRKLMSSLLWLYFALSRRVCTGGCSLMLISCGFHMCMWQWSQNAMAVLAGCVGNYGIHAAAKSFLTVGGLPGGIGGLLDAAWMSSLEPLVKDSKYVTCPVHRPICLLISMDCNLGNVATLASGVGISSVTWMGLFVMPVNSLKWWNPMMPWLLFGRLCMMFLRVLVRTLWQFSRLEKFTGSSVALLAFFDQNLWPFALMTSSNVFGLLSWFVFVMWVTWFSDSAVSRLGACSAAWPLDMYLRVMRVHGLHLYLLNGNLVSLYLGCDGLTCLFVVDTLMIYLFSHVHGAMTVYVCFLPLSTRFPLTLAPTLALWHGWTWKSTWTLFA